MATGGGGPAVVNEIVVGSATTRPRIHSTTSITTQTEGVDRSLGWRAGRLVYSTNTADRVVLQIHSITGGMMDERTLDLQPGVDEIPIAGPSTGVRVATVRRVADGRTFRLLVPGLR
jgi:hypothetical protein